jgi:hypothetical protein
MLAWQFSATVPGSETKKPFSPIQTKHTNNASRHNLRRGSTSTTEPSSYSSTSITSTNPSTTKFSTSSSWEHPSTNGIIMRGYRHSRRNTTVDMRCWVLDGYGTWSTTTIYIIPSPCCSSIRVNHNMDW